MSLCSVECVTVAHNKRSEQEDFFKRAQLTNLHTSATETAKSNQRLAKARSDATPHSRLRCSSTVVTAAAAAADLARTRCRGSRGPPADRLCLSAAGCLEERCSIIHVLKKLRSSDATTSRFVFLFCFITKI